MVCSIEHSVCIQIEIHVRGGTESAKMRNIPSNTLSQERRNSASRHTTRQRCEVIVATLNGCYFVHFLNAPELERERERERSSVIENIDRKQESI